MATTTADAHRLARRLGARLAAVRHQRGLTQERCAWEAGLSKAYLSQIEAGRRLPSLAVLLALAERLQVELGALFASPAAAHRSGEMAAEKKPRYRPHRPKR